LSIIEAAHWFMRDDGFADAAMDRMLVGADETTGDHSKCLGHLLNLPSPDEDI
jgi:hypothetical protein